MSLYFYYLIFPGLLFAAISGGLLSWFDRKVTAWVQFRKGPPVLQPFYDVLKLLMVKETILPARGSAMVFLLAPVLALFGATMAAVFILLAALGINTGFTGDVIVIFYLLNIPALSYIIGAMASGNPLASLGASREIKLIVSYELTFLLVIAAVIYKAGMSISLYDIIQAQAGNTFIGSLSGMLLFVAAMFCVQAKLGLIPFDIAEAETEINHGSFIEYSGTAYAIVLLTKYIMLFALPAFIVVLFLGGLGTSGLGVVYSILKVLLIVLLITLIRNTNPRARVDQAMRFFFGWMNGVVIVAFVLMFFGL